MGIQIFGFPLITTKYKMKETKNIELTEEIEKSLIRRGRVEAKAIFSSYVEQMKNLHKDNRLVISSLDFLQDLLDNFESKEE